MERLLSGVQPSGQLHIGNYLGAIKQWVEFQHDYDAFFCIVDYHALTTRPKPADLREQTLHTVAMLVALGIDPKSAAVFLQSQVSEHTELAWIFNNFTTLGQLNRMTQFKEKSGRHGQYVGLYTYPVLMAADILIYQAEAVPVGEDQVQHLELAREIARSFNAHAGEVFVEPKPILNTSARIMALNDPTKKMSKSLPGSAIGLLDDEKTITQTIKRAVTDSDPNASEMSPALKNLFMILEGFSSEDTVTQFKKMRGNGTLRYSELKEQLIEDIVTFLGPVQKTYHSLIKNDRELELILAKGREQAQAVAKETLSAAKDKLGLIS